MAWSPVSVHKPPLSAELRVKLGNYQMPRSHNDSNNIHVIGNCHSSFNYQAVAVYHAPAKLSMCLISALRHPGALRGGIISAQQNEGQAQGHTAGNGKASIPILTG